MGGLINVLYYYYYYCNWGKLIDGCRLALCSATDSVVSAGIYATEIKSIKLHDSIEGLSQKIIYITLHYITLHYITLHYITLHYITLHYITLHYITLHYITLHYITLHYITLHSI